MNYAILFFCTCSMICSIVAVLIAGEILPPIDPIDLSVGLLMMMALFLVYIAADISKGDDNGEDQKQD